MYIMLFSLFISKNDMCYAMLLVFFAKYFLIVLFIIMI